VIGNDAVLTLSGQAGNFELNVMLPVIAHNLLQSIHLLGHAVTVFGEKCVKGISANPEKCTSNLEKSLALATALVPAIGYDRAAALAREAYETGKTVREAALEARVLPAEEINKIMDAIVGD